MGWPLLSTGGTSQLPPPAVWCSALCFVVRPKRTFVRRAEAARGGGAQTKDQHVFPGTSRQRGGSKQLRELRQRAWIQPQTTSPPIRSRLHSSGSRLATKACCLKRLYETKTIAAAKKEILTVGSPSLISIDSFSIFNGEKVVTWCRKMHQGWISHSSMWCLSVTFLRGIIYLSLVVSNTHIQREACTVKYITLDSLLTSTLWNYLPANIQ